LSDYCKIDVYSHHFSVTKVSPRLRPLIQNFLRPLVEWTGHYARGKFHKKMAKVYAASNAERTYYRFHINQYEEFLDMLKNANIPPSLVEITVKRMYTPTEVDYNIPDHWVPRDDQPRVIQYMEDPGESKVVTLATGGGKAQPLDAAIKVPGGWLTMGDMAVGQDVIAKDGSTTKVTAIHPQGKKAIYKLTFSDGRTTECCKEHLWRVYNPDQGWTVKQLGEILEHRKSNPNARYYIDLPESEKNEGKALPLDPYVLGLILGDGHVGNQVLKFSTPDKELLEALHKNLPAGMTLSQAGGVDYNIIREDKSILANPWLTILEEMGLRGKLSHEKFIPEEYLDGSTYQRRSLLQGLMDTDGTVSENKSSSFSTSSLLLAQQFQYLARSLGHHAKLTSKVPKYTYRGEQRVGKTAYRVHLRAANPTELFRLPRHIAKLSESNQYSKNFKLALTSIEYVGEKEAQCISIAHDDKLYVTDDFIVTHNTFCSQKAAETLGVLTCFQMGGKYIEKWIGDLEDCLGLKKKEICVIRGSAALLSAINLALAGEFDYKAIIASTTTLARFYKDYEAGKLRGYPIKPWNLWKVLGVGLRVVDEAHENQHQIFKMDLYAHIPKTIFLSATITTDSPFRNRMLQIQWPERMRFTPGDFDRYIRVKALLYELWEPEKIRHINQQKMYSHTLFEESLIKRPLYLAQYLAMIDSLVYEWYVKRRDDGQKCLVFAATKEMCGKIADHLAKRNPTLEVARYISEDDYEVLMESDISASTALSAGTGVDIPGLRYSLMTTNINSSQANIQIVGRLRRLKDWPDVEPDFMYILARNLPKHMEYHEKKKKLLRPRVKSIGELNSTFVIGRPNK